MNIQQMMKQAQQMQDKLQKQMADAHRSNGGRRHGDVVINGAKRVLSLNRSEAVSDDVEMLRI
jgi:DNA-binding protein YbaB